MLATLELLSLLLSGRDDPNKFFAIVETYNKSKTYNCFLWYMTVILAFGVSLQAFRLLWSAGKLCSLCGTEACVFFVQI